jgi:hypothetical protein
LNETLASPLHWLIVRNLDERTDVLTLHSRGGGGASLPVFSHSGEAARFLYYHPEASGAGWRVRETPAVELASLLQGCGAEVKWVVLDPVPEDVEGALVEPLRLERAEFTRVLLREPSNEVRRNPSLMP